jgi:hypothetical protein
MDTLTQSIQWSLTMKLGAGRQMLIGKNGGDETLHLASEHLHQTSALACIWNAYSSGWGRKIC